MRPPNTLRCFMIRLPPPRTFWKGRVLSRMREAFRMTLMRNNNGANEVKLVQAINIHCDVQKELEALMKAHLER